MEGEYPEKVSHPHLEKRKNSYISFRELIELLDPFPYPFPILGKGSYSLPEKSKDLITLI
jgi:hypothetical protein